MRHIVLILLISMFSIVANAQDAFTMSSSSFTDQSALPNTFTCDGGNTSPEIEWANPPDKTVSFVLILSDPEAPNGTFYHWVIYNIPNSITTIPQGGLIPAGAAIGVNSANQKKYFPPCPPKGSTHHYIFMLYALDKTLTLPVDANANVVIDEMQYHILGATQLTTTYSR